jgi:hypothetical protein
MMKHLLLLATLLLFLSPGAPAQRRKSALPPAPPLDVPIVYCVLVVVDPGYNQHLALDYGQLTPTNVQDTTMEALAVTISPMMMISTAAALNYLYSKGWEPIQSAAFTYDQTSDHSVKSQLHYVLHRRTP